MEFNLGLLDIKGFEGIGLLPRIAILTKYYLDILREIFNNNKTVKKRSG